MNTQRNEANQEKRRLYVYVPVRLFAEIRYHASLAGKTLSEYVTGILSDAMREDGDDR